MTPYFLQHPGGSAILRNAGGDSTDGFRGQTAHHNAETIITKLLDKHFIGDLAK